MEAIVGCNVRRPLVGAGARERGGAVGRHRILRRQLAVPHVPVPSNNARHICIVNARCLHAGRRGRRAGWSCRWAAAVCLRGASGRRANAIHVSIEPMGRSGWSAWPTACQDCVARSGSREKLRSARHPGRRAAPTRLEGAAADSRTRAWPTPPSTF